MAAEMRLVDGKKSGPVAERKEVASVSLIDTRMQEVVMMMVD